MHDVTTRTWRERASTSQMRQLREMPAYRRQLHSVFDAVDGAISDAVVVFDGAEHVVHANARARELLDLAQSSDRTALDLRVDLVLPMLRDRRGVVLDAQHELMGRILHGEAFTHHRLLDALLYNRRTGSEVPLGITGAPIRDEDGKIIGGVLTLRVASGSRRSASAPDTQPAQQNSYRAAHVETTFVDVVEAEPKDEFFATAAHELRNATTSVHGYVSMLTERTTSGLRSRLTKWQTEALEALVQAADHLIEFADDFMDVARLQTGQLELRCLEADLVALTQRVALVHQAATDRHSIDFTSTADSIMAPIDVRRIEQVLTNLIGNAVKYSPDGGKIGVVVHKSRACDSAMVTVHDHGIGIPPDENDQIFRRFGRAENARRLGIDGTGLGLYLSREIVERHGGSLSFSSSTATDGHTTTFYLSLPTNSHRQERRECEEGS